MHGLEFSDQDAMPAGRLGCPARAVDGLRRLTRRECDHGELRLAVIVNANVTERCGQARCLFEGELEPPPLLLQQRQFAPQASRYG